MRYSFVFAILTTLVAAVSLRTDEPKAAEAKGPEVKTVVLRPQAVPRPALKYPLLPGAFEENSGNAATLYLRAFLLQSQTVIEAEKKTKASDWLDLPLDKLPRKEVGDYLARYEFVFSQLEGAALRETCDWGLPWREGDTPFTMLLPEAQAARESTRLLALKARWQLAEGKPLEAVATLRAGYVLARRINEQKVIISSLVAVANCSMLNERLLELMQQTGAPNLFWSITDLPHPMVDIREGLRFEAAALQLTFRESFLASQHKLTNDEANVAWAKFLARWNTLSDMLGSEDPTWKKVVERFAGAVAVTVYYPGAKKNLLARGRTEKEVADMPAAQVVLIDIFDTYADVRDEQFKWFALPFPEQRGRFADAEAKIKAAKESGSIGGMLAGMLLPALSRASEACARGERRLGALACLEAIRAYAAAHEGKLPASLADIKDLPVPLNAVTGKPFEYRLEGEKAVLLEDGLDDRRDRRYEITFAK